MARDEIAPAAHWRAGVVGVESVRDAWSRVRRMDGYGRERRRRGGVWYGAVVGLLLIGVIGAGAWGVRNVVRSARAGAVASGPTGSEQRVVGVSEGDAAMRAAEAYLRQDEGGKAETVLRALTEKAPQRQDAWLLLGETLLGQGRKEEAYSAYTRAMGVGSASGEMRFAAGVLASDLGKLEESAEHLSIAQAKDPGSAKAALYLAQVQRLLHRDAEAKASLVRATVLDPGLAIGWAGLADLALDENKVEMARQHVEKARGLEPESARWAALEARVYRRENKPEAGLRMLLGLGGDVVEGDAGLVEEAATCYGMLGRVGDAASLTARASGKRPEDVGLALAAARWAERAGDVVSAGVYAESAARLGSAEGREMLKRLGERAAGTN